ncbi:MAG: hypothetical protein ACYDG3_14510 [Bacillati bacterium]
MINMGCEQMLDIIDTKLRHEFYKIQESYEEEAFTDRKYYQDVADKINYAKKYLKDHRDELIKECEEKQRQE